MMSPLTCLQAEEEPVPCLTCNTGKCGSVSMQCQAALQSCMYAPLKCKIEKVPFKPALSSVPCGARTIMTLETNEKCSVHAQHHWAVGEGLPAARRRSPRWGMRWAGRCRRRAGSRSRRPRRRPDRSASRWPPPGSCREGNSVRGTVPCYDTLQGLHRDKQQGEVQSAAVAAACMLM